MNYSESGEYDNAISIEWDKLLEDNENVSKYILDALMLTPSDSRRKVVNGKQQKAVQLFSIRNSISTNANPEKKGLTYLAMRAIHFWKTLYERSLQDPQLVEENREKYVPRLQHIGVRDNLMSEINIIQDELVKMMKDGNMVSKDEFSEVQSDLYKLQSKYDNLKFDMETKKKEDQKFYDMREREQDHRHEQEVEYWKNRCKQISAKNQQSSSKSS